MSGDELVAEWQPQTHHEATGGFMNAGIIGTLLDCHSNWTAAYYLMKTKGWKKPHCTVTAFFNVSLIRTYYSGLFCSDSIIHPMVHRHLSRINSSV